jgi:hypothetical protein
MVGPEVALFAEAEPDIAVGVVGTMLAAAVAVAVVIAFVAVEAEPAAAISCSSFLCSQRVAVAAASAYLCRCIHEMISLIDTKTPLDVLPSVGAS